MLRDGLVLKSVLAMLSMSFVTTAQRVAALMCVKVLSGAGRASDRTSRRRRTRFAAQRPAMVYQATHVKKVARDRGPVRASRTIPRELKSIPTPGTALGPGNQVGEWAAHSAQHLDGWTWVVPAAGTGRAPADRPSSAALMPLRGSSARRPGLRC